MELLFLVEVARSESICDVAPFSISYSFTLLHKWTVHSVDGVAEDLSVYICVTKRRQLKSIGFNNSNTTTHFILNIIFFSYSPCHVALKIMHPLLCKCSHVLYRYSSMRQYLAIQRRFSQTSPACLPLYVSPCLFSLLCFPLSVFHYLSSRSYRT